jgi:hypothetical protein
MNQEGRQVIVFSSRMRAFVVTYTFYREASSQSILINAQGTKHLSQCIVELIKYTNQEARDKPTNANYGQQRTVTFHLGFYSTGKPSTIILIFKRQILNF